MRATAIIAAGGSGVRMGGKTPKGFLELGGRPLLFHSLETFAGVRFVREIILVAPESWITRLERQFGAVLEGLKVSKIVPGGRRRQDSVRNGLRVISPESELVLVHDAARPFVSAALIRRVALAAQKHGAALPALPARDTMKIVDSRLKVVQTTPRERTWAAQTPQGVQVPLFLAAYRSGGRKEATDDVQLVERAGGKVVVVRGDPRNFKITDPADLEKAAQMLRKKKD